MEDVEMNQISVCLPSRPVLEMALNLDQFRIEVQGLISAGKL
jgi:hypothetical protein